MDRSRLNRLPVLFLATVLASVGVLTPRSSGQIVDIPTTIATNTGVQSAEARQTIKAYVDENSKNLLKADPNDPLPLKRDRDAILRKLEGDDVSVSFRLAYDEELQPHLKDMLASKDERTVINALVIAGELATDRTLAQVQSKLTQPPQPPAIRYEAAVSLKRIFRAVQNSQRAVNQLGGAVSSLQELIAKETDAHVREALIQAGLAAAASGEERPRAISAVSKGVTGAIKTMKAPPTEAELQALVRAGAGMRDVMTRAVQQNVPVPPAAAKDAAEMAGNLLAYTVKVVRAVPPDPKNASLREVLLAQLAGSAQTTIELTGEMLGTRVPGPPKMVSNLRENSVQGDARFSEDVLVIVGQNGVLTKAPFELAADKFK